jgi:uracil-DNA glycosylase family 4
MNYNSTMPISQIEHRITECNRCDRLRTWCKKVAVEKRKSFQNDTYWGKPVHGFGDHNARLLIVGLAPAAHGANRTGRMFTGDNSGLWLYRALFEHGFSNQQESIHRTDQLKLSNAYITAVVHCAPPDNKPTTDEIGTCISYLRDELDAMKNLTTILSLGSISWDAIQNIGKEKGWITKKRKFGHGATMQMGPYQLIGSYHPSQQNTFTKRLTKEMFDAIFSTIKTMLK